MYCYYANNSYLCTNVYHYVMGVVCNLQTYLFFNILKFLHYELFFN